MADEESAAVDTPNRSTVHDSAQKQMELVVPIAGCMLRSVISPPDMSMETKETFHSSPNAKSSTSSTLVFYSTPDFLTSMTTVETSSIFI
ncbi:hypothetical protein ACTXT7_005575 [Hymenolepis weldensis]